MPEERPNLSPDEVRDRLRMIPGILSGRLPDPTGVVGELQLAVGMQALSLIKEAFITKSRGGTDEAGIKWKPLDPKTIAYGRRHPGLNRKRTTAAKKGRASRPLLSDAQDKRWRAVYAQTLRTLLNMRTSLKESQARAAAAAWTVLKAEGAQTILGTYGTAEVEIGRDTGRLFNSLSPDNSRNSDRVLRAEPGSVVVGTNVEYAERFHRDRPLAPEPENWPDSWRNALQDVVNQGMERLIEHLMRV